MALYVIVSKTANQKQSDFSLDRDDLNLKTY